MNAPRYDERKVLLVVAATQFVNIVDFMIVMPLGNDFASELQIAKSHLGYVGGSYTAAASVAGFVGAFFLDRFDRKRALLCAIFGLSCGTISAVFAHNLNTLLFARVIAGAFGGPASALAISIVSDVIPAERRGRAMGLVMMAFSLASVLGVPLALESARLFGWRTPFVAVALLGLAVAVAAGALLPKIHPEKGIGRSPIQEVRGLFRREVGRSLLITLAAMVSSFSLIPNITPYVLSNLSYPRKLLSYLYLGGGIASFFTIRQGGVLVDKYGSSRMAAVASVVFSLVVLLGFVVSPPLLPVPLVFVFFMVSMSFRNVAYNTLTSKVPAGHERGAFQSVQSAVQHLAAAFGAFASSWLLTEGADRNLVGMPKVALASIAIGTLVPPLMWVLERTLAARTAEARAAKEVGA